MRRQDLDDLFDYIAADRPLAAERFLLEIKRACEGLRWFPMIGQRLDPEIDPEARIFAEMEINAERRGAARHQVAFIPPRQIAAGIPLEQGVAIPQGRREQHHRDGDGDRPGQPHVRDARA